MMDELETDAREMIVCLDIDRTIAYGFHEDTLNEILEKFPWVAEFRQRGLLIHALKWHVIHPGVIELIKWLDDQKITLAFFSSGDKERNRILVADLCQLALGIERYCEIAQKIIILSREDLTPDPSKQSSRNTKDLQKITRSAETFLNTILVDDDSSYTHPNQDRHVLWPRFSTDYSDFDAVHRYSSRTSSIHSVNAVFYVSGVLSQAIDRARRTHSSLSDAMSACLPSSLTAHSRDNRLVAESACLPSSLKTRSRDNRLVADYVASGIQILQTINPNLALCAPRRLFAPNYRVNESLALDRVITFHMMKSLARAEEYAERKEIASERSHQLMGYYPVFLHITREIEQRKAIQAEADSQSASLQAAMHWNSPYERSERSRQEMRLRPRPLL